MSKTQAKVFQAPQSVMKPEERAFWHQYVRHGSEHDPELRDQQLYDARCDRATESLEIEETR